MPRVLPFSSMPVNLERFHSPFFSDASAHTTLRASDSIMAIVCSAADMMLAEGVFITRMPRRVAALTSTLSTPTPARPITFKFFPASTTSAVTLVPERMTSAS